MGHRLSGAAISACVLAAGTSTRFGATKLVQHLRGKPLLQHALLAAQGACKGRVTLVVGHDADAVVAASADLSDSIVINRKHQQGIGTSISAGVQACRDGADAILIILADQPLVTATHLNDLIEHWSGADNEVVASSFDAVISPPILFPKNAFDELCKSGGDTGAKGILANDKLHVRSIEFPPAQKDVDTPEDLQDLAQD